MKGFRHSAQSVDPFADFSILSLLPRTVGMAAVHLPPSSQVHEAESIRSFLKSSAVENCKDILEQAKKIDKSHQCSGRVSEKDEDMAHADGCQQGRRPALGRKRAQFSMKPVVPRNSIPCVDTNSQLEHIEDPEEYFAIFERLENAEKELKKLRGDISTDPVQNDQKETRKRRPGLLRKTASHKHRFSVTDAVPEACKVLVTDAAPDACKVLQKLAPDSVSSSVGMSNNILFCNTSDQPTTTLQPTNTAGLSLDSKKGADDNEGVANTLLDNLLCSFKELDEGEEEALLRKSLHIKSIDVGKIHLPEFHTVQLVDPKASNTNQVQNRLSMCQLQQSPTSKSSPLAANFSLHKGFSSRLQTSHLVSPSSMVSDRSDWKAKRVSTSGVSNVHNEMSSPVDKLFIPHTGAETIIDDNSKTEEELTEACCCSDKNITEQNHKIVDNGSNISGQVEEEGNDIHVDNVFSKGSCPEVEHVTSSSCEINMTRRLMNTDHECAADHGSWRSDVNASLCNDTHLDNVIPNYSSPEHLASTCHEINITDSCPEVEHITSSGCGIEMTKRLTSTGDERTTDHGSSRRDIDASLWNDLHLNDIIPNDTSPEVEHSASTCHEINITESSRITEHECVAGFSSLRSDDDTGLIHAHNILQNEVSVMAEDDQLADVNCSTVYPCPSTSLPPTDEPAADTSTLLGENYEAHRPQGSQNEAGKQKSSRTRQNKEKLKSKVESVAGAGSRNETRKQKPLKTRQNHEKLNSKRQSLAGAGLGWQSGVRHSTRIRTRPLEFWRGERFLYGRIHESLATVIGVKYASPGKEEGSKGRALKVKSFVSDEYKDLISQAAS